MGTRKLLKMLISWLKNQRLIKLIFSDRVSLLENAIKKHRDAKGHQSCWLNDQELYTVLDEGMPDRSLPAKIEFLTACKKYYEEQANNSNPPSRTPLTMVAAWRCSKCQHLMPYVVKSELPICEICN